MTEKINLDFNTVDDFQKAYPTKAEKEEVLSLMTDDQIDRLISTCRSPYAKLYYSSFKEGGSQHITYYYLKDEHLFAKRDSHFQDFIFRDGEWQQDMDCLVSDKLLGYDQYEDDDSPYGFGSTSVMNEIVEITGEEILSKIGLIRAGNSANPGNGAAFQKSVRDWFVNHYGPGFELETKIPIGTSDERKKDHKFDIVNLKQKIVIECKRYTWTETGNVPSAKMGFTNEAAFYLSFLPDDYEKYIVMLKSNHTKRKESLAEYYFRTNRHLLGKTIVAEYDPSADELRIVGKNE